MKIRLIYFVIIAALLAACVKKENKPCETLQSADSLDANLSILEKQAKVFASYKAPNWVGDYTGVLPCADCEGIQTLITLNDDTTFFVKMEYLGKGKPFHDKGFFTWSNDKKKVILEMDDGVKQAYLLGDSTLTMLNSQGEVTTGELAEYYVLKKRR